MDYKYQFSRHLLKGMSTCIMKVVHRENRFFSFFFLLLLSFDSPLGHECACRFCSTIYILMYNTTRRGGGVRGGSDVLFLREINVDFPQEYIYIYNRLQKQHSTRREAREGDQGRGV
jgi:hypothetical protein